MDDNKIVRQVEKKVNGYWLKLIRKEKEPVEQLSIYLNSLYYCNPMVELGIDIELQKVKLNYEVLTGLTQELVQQVVDIAQEQLEEVRRKMKEEDYQFEDTYF